jgi:hypothetical protein
MRRSVSVTLIPSAAGPDAYRLSVSTALHDEGNKVKFESYILEDVLHDISQAENGLDVPMWAAGLIYAAWSLVNENAKGYRPSVRSATELPVGASETLSQDM